MPAVSGIYTILVSHSDVAQFGGSAAQYGGSVATLVNGFVADHSSATSTVIAWIYYPGGGVAFADYMFVFPPKASSEAYAQYLMNIKPDEFTPPLKAVIYQTASLGFHTVSTNITDLGTLQAGAAWPDSELVAANNTPGTPSTDFLFLIECKHKPSQIEIIAKLDTGCEIHPFVIDPTNTAAYLIDSTGAALTNLVPTAPLSWVKYQVFVPPFKPLVPGYGTNGTWTIGQFWMFKMSVFAPLSTTCKFAQVKASYDQTLVQQI